MPVKTRALALLTATVLSASLVPQAAAAPKPKPGSGSGSTTTTVVASAATPTLVGDMSTANVESPSGDGRRVWSLMANNGTLHYGSGDYGLNTGSTPVADGVGVGTYNLATGTFGTAMQVDSEAVQVFRPIGTGLYTPVIDPNANHEARGNSFVSNGSGTWAAAPGPVASHVFDVATSNGSDRFVAGTIGSRAVIWRSVDGGRTWAESLSWTDADPAARDGYERFYWMSRVGNSVYAYAAYGTKTDGAPAPLMRFDASTGAWSKVADPSGTTWDRYLPRTMQARNVLSDGQRLMYADGAGLYWFSGPRSMGTIAWPSEARAAGAVTLSADRAYVYGLVMINSDFSAPRMGIVRYDLAARTSAMVWRDPRAASSTITFDALEVVGDTAYFVGVDKSVAGDPRSKLWKVRIGA